MRRYLLLVTGDPVPSAAARAGDFAQMIRHAAGPQAAEWEVVDIRDPGPLPPVGEQDAVVVSGSPALLSEQTEWMIQGMQYLRELVQQRVPTLGICFGHQMLGEALGGRVGRNPRGREIGSVELEVTERSPLLEDQPPMYANTTHVDSVLELPQGSRVVARTALEPHAAVQFAEAAWGVQFHPEMDAQIVRCYIRERRQALLEEGLDPDALDETARDALAGASVLARFLERCVD